MPNETTPLTDEELFTLEHGAHVTAELRHRAAEQIKNGQRLAEAFVLFRANCWAIECSPEQMKILSTIMAAPNRALAFFQGKEPPA